MCPKIIDFAKQSSIIDLYSPYSNRHLLEFQTRLISFGMYSLSMVLVMLSVFRLKIKFALFFLQINLRPTSSLTSTKKEEEVKPPEVSEVNLKISTLIHLSKLWSMPTNHGLTISAADSY